MITFETTFKNRRVINNLFLEQGSRESAKMFSHWINLLCIYFLLSKITNSTWIISCHVFVKIRRKNYCETFISTLIDILFLVIAINRHKITKFVPKLVLSSRLHYLALRSFSSPHDPHLTSNKFPPRFYACFERLMRMSLIENGAEIAFAFIAKGEGEALTEPKTIKKEEKKKSFRCLSRLLIFSLCA